MALAQTDCKARHGDVSQAGSPHCCFYLNTSFVHLTNNCHHYLSGTAENKVCVLLAGEVADGQETAQKNAR